ncbi:leucyl aminopeptidase family protein [Pacificimonas sp. ICDLI1SI03]
MQDMKTYLAVDRDQGARALTPVTTSDFEPWKEELSPRARAAVEAAQFTGEAFTQAILPGSDADAWSVAVGLGAAGEADMWALAASAKALPQGTYRLDGEAPQGAALGWALGQYRFDRYLRGDAPQPRVLLVADQDILTETAMLAEAQALVRDLVNTPAEDMGPADLEVAIRHEAETFGAAIKTITGPALLSENYPAIHAVGRAAAPGREPRLVRLDWGDADAPQLTLVGKGVCFDSGGLDVKSAAGMRHMKKDMGGAAHAIALARLVMQSALPVRLTLLVAAVENSVSANALRPGDVMATRKGLSVEIHNTDAEGRLVLCDCLALAEEEEPDLLIDFATLTGAARVALGPDLPAMMTRDDDIADALQLAGSKVDDPIWRLPLWSPYLKMLKSEIADLSNAASGGFAGAITAGLYLSRFVEADTKWVHFDTFAWMPAARPGRPLGGEALGLRASFAMIRLRYTPN